MLAGAGFAVAQQSTDYLIVEIPIGTQSEKNVLWIKWAGVSRGITYPAPDSGTIYYDRSPGGGDLRNYRYTIETPYTDTATDSVMNNIYYPPSIDNPVAKRGIAFRPMDQEEMGFGVFYCVVAFPMENDTFVSNEFQLMVESPEPVDWIGPSGEVSSVTPTFQWEANTGVPYYHIILSDDIIKIDSSSGEVSLEGLSIIWQAITPATQMIYGAPDPSNTITADPPPLSPGQNYTWVVLNNYGNHPAFSSMKVKLPPGEFSIKGESLNKPVCMYPSDTTLNSTDHKKVVFKWKNLDENANTYKVYIYVGSDFEGINAQLVVFQTEVVADGRSGENEVDSVEIDAASVLTSNKYVWRVIAVNDQGAGTVGDTIGFHYSAPVGEMKVYTKEQIVISSDDGLDTVVNPVGLVELKVEVLDGSLEAPLLFYTDNNGYLKRERPVGTYRVTAIKNEFEQQSKTIIVENGKTKTDTFFLERPDATVFGKVVDKSGKGINLANVYGVSDRGDTVTTKADALGNFVLNCYAADWSVGVNMTGYQPVLPQQVTVESAESYNFGTITMEKNPFTLSGVVKNTSGAALLGVRVRVYQDGTQLNEVPSTPESGVFSFTLPAGTYTLKADKTGFTSYSKSIDVLSSKNITVTMEPGAALVTGYVYGKTWVGDREVIAPITGAEIFFVQGSTGDTTSVVSDPTYGDFKASLPGNKDFSMYSSANGYVEKDTPIEFTTKPKTTQTMYDTLQGLGILSGSALLSEDKQAVARANLTLVEIENNNVVSTGKSTVNGSFELQSIPDGSYFLRAAKEGFVLDSISGNDTIVFSGGKVTERTSVRVYLKPGDKTIKWTLVDDEIEDVAIKMQSPLVKTLNISDSLTESGPGSYIVSVDASDEKIIDLSYHTFTVADSEVVHVDSIHLDVRHEKADSIEPEKGMITLTLTASNELDSACIFYKDAVANAYRTKTIALADTEFVFEFTPPKDGSTMLYYFSAWRGSDVYGYDKETYRVYVLPDRTMLTRFEIVPSSDETFSFPSSYEAAFSIKGYVSSAFIPDTSIDGDGMSWALKDAQGCSLEDEEGLAVVVTTGSKKTTKAVTLQVTIDTTVIPISPAIEPTVMVTFNVTGAPVIAITVTRTDAGNPNPISTAETEQAEFSASGFDADSSILDLMPQWSISPADAGSINSTGVFKPARNYAGRVRIIATVGEVTGEYFLDDKTGPGLNVRFMIVRKESWDTVSNKMGCGLAFPPNVVNGTDIGLLEIANTQLVNQFKRGFGNIRTVDTLAYAIRQLENIVLELDNDSIYLNLSIPEHLQKKVASGKQNVAIAQWIEDSLLWKPLASSRVNDDGTMVTAGLTHFSRYCIVYEPSDELSMSVAPNPFSPFIVPPYNPFNTSERVRQHNGTCIKIQADIKEARVEARLRIYTATGEMVWNMLIQNADNLPYYVWWDGRTSSRELQPNGGDHVVVIKGNKMCRNGRYFAVLSAKISGKEQKKMKQIILMK